MIDKAQARDVRGMIRKAGDRDVFIDQGGRVRTLPAGSTYVGTYNGEISSLDLWKDLRYVLKQTDYCRNPMPEKSSG